MGGRLKKLHGSKNGYWGSEASKHLGSRKRLKQREMRARNWLAETLEAHVHLATFNVLNTNDSGDGSLRAAIDAANLASGPDEIKFTGAVFTDATADTIKLSSPQLELTDSSEVTITGPGANQLII